MSGQGANEAELQGLRVREHAPGVLAVSLDGSNERLFSMDAYPRTTIALHRLLDALQTEARLAADGPPDISRWAGAFRIVESDDAG